MEAGGYRLQLMTPVLLPPSELSFVLRVSERVRCTGRCCSISNVSKIGCYLVPLSFLYLALGVMMLLSIIYILLWLQCKQQLHQPIRELDDPSRKGALLHLQGSLCSVL